MKKTSEPTTDLQPPSPTTDKCWHKPAFTIFAASAAEGNISAGDDGSGTFTAS